MATRANRLSIALPDARDLAAWRPVLPSDRRTAAWQIVTAPWWFWSDIPKLPLPVRNPALPPGGPAGDWVVRGIDRIATRVWIQRMLAIMARGIGLVLSLGCLWLIVELLGGPALDPLALAGIGVVLLTASLMLALLSRPSRAQTARMLDRSFTLHERISTALGNIGVEVASGDEPPAVVYLQVVDAANAITAAREHPAFRLRLPIRELVLAIVVALTFVALAFARGVGGEVPGVATNVVPAFVPAAQRFVQQKPEPRPVNPQNAPSVADVQKMMQESIDNQHDLSALADALSDHALTRDAAQMIQQGQYTAAAEALRDVANQADQLSDGERQDLANDLNQAASQMSAGNKTLSEATSQAAEGLQQGGDPSREGVRTLANAVEQSGQQVQSPEALDQAMQQAQQQAAANPQAQTGSQNGNQGQQSPNQDASSSNGQQASDAAGQQAGQTGATDASGGANADGNAGQDAPQAGQQEGQGAGAQSGDAGSAGQPGGQSQSDQSAPGGASGQSSQPSNDQAQGENANASQGSGAGGQSTEQDQPQNAQEGSSPSGQAAPASVTGKKPSNANVSGDAQAGTDTSGPSADPREAVTLDRSPQEAPSVQISSSSGQAQLGSGNGVTVSNGSATQGDVGQSGPDSNHVPPQYRSVVENYFSDKDHGG